MQKSVFTYLLVFISTAIFAQSNLRIKKIVFPADTFLLDSLTIAPETVFLFDENNLLLGNDAYEILPSGEMIAPRLAHQKIEIRYRVFPDNYNQPYFHKDISLFEFDTIIDNTSFWEHGQPSFFDNGDDSKVNTSGSIARGLSAGNNQDIIMNSSMNLQMDGYLTNTIQIAASVSDQNIPIQPEGNSQQISEFDQVYIKLFTEDHSAIFGDFETSNRNGEFLLYNKKGLGAKGHTSFELEKERTIETDVSFAISKGKYCSKEIESMEGNQGPYRLIGCNNEAFIIILSGSERVYINGKLVKRGENLDYTIDYNSAEVTFTSRQPITKDSRISIEFEYSEQNYARFFVSENLSIKTKKSTTWVNVFSEQDNKNQPYQQDSLSRIEDALYRAGDGVAFVDNVMIDTIWDVNKIYYELRDTVLLDGRAFDSVYVQTYDQTKGQYLLGFSYVGINGGNYTRIQSAANGKVYAWSAPFLDGTPSGDYLPVSIVTAPEKKQIIAAGSTIKIFEQTELYIEGAVSNYDKNTGSPYSNEDNAGTAGTAKLTQYFPLQDSNTIAVYGSYQIVDKNFTGINSFRPVEFTRDWSLNNGEPTNSSLSGVGIKYLSKHVYSDISHSTFIRTDQYNGQRENISARITPGGFKAITTGSILRADASEYSSQFNRLSGDISQKVLFARIGVLGEYEKNNKRDSLQYLFFDAQSYTQYGVYTESADSSGFVFKIAHLRRKDFAPSESYERFIHTANSEDYSADIGLYTNPNHSFGLGATYRILSIADSSWGTRNNIAPEKNLTTRAEHTVRAWKGAIRNRIFLETGSGLELKRDYNFVEVTSGQGSYQWIDYNNNGIPEINEFEIAQYQQQGNYMRVFLSTNEYVRVYTNEFNHSFSIEPYSVWRKSTGFKMLASRLAIRTAYNYNRKIDRTNFWVNLAPTQYFLDNVLIHSLQSSFRGSLHVNRPNHTLSGIYNYSVSKNKFLSSNGSESRNATENSGTLRWNISDMFTWYGSGKYKIEASEMEAQFLSNKEYNILSYAASPKLEMQPSPSLVFAGEYEYTDKQNLSIGRETSVKNDFSVESRYSKADKGRLSVKLSTIFIQYSGTENTSLSYTMLDGLLPGKNYVWELQYSKNISEFLNLSATYNGQKSEDSRPLHLGSIQLKAFF